MVLLRHSGLRYTSVGNLSSGVGIMVATCPACQKQSRIPAGYQGNRVKCPGCKTSFDLPSDDDSDLGSGSIPINGYHASVATPHGNASTFIPTPPPLATSSNPQPLVSAPLPSTIVGLDPWYYGYLNTIAYGAVALGVVTGGLIIIGGLMVARWIADIPEAPMSMVGGVVVGCLFLGGGIIVAALYIPAITLLALDMGRSLRVTARR